MLQTLRICQPIPLLPTYHQRYRNRCTLYWTASKEETNDDGVQFPTLSQMP